MSDPTAHDRDADTVPEEPTEDEPPDESELMGKSGVEQEVLAELARVESELADPNAPAEPEGEEGAQV